MIKGVFFKDISAISCGRGTNSKKPTIIITHISNNSQTVIEYNTTEEMMSKYNELLDRGGGMDMMIEKE